MHVILLCIMQQLPKAVKDDPKSLKAAAGKLQEVLDEKLKHLFHKGLRSVFVQV